MYTIRMLQAHKLHDRIHDIELSTMDATTVGEVMYFLLPLFRPIHYISSRQLLT